MKKKYLVLLLILFLSAFVYFNKKSLLGSKSFEHDLLQSSHISSKEIKTNGYWPSQNSGKHIWIEKDPHEKNPEEINYEMRLQKYLNKEFYNIPEGSDLAKKSKMYQSVDYWTSNYIDNGDVWYRSEFSEEISDSKFILFFHFKKINSKTDKYFEIYTFNYRDDNWFKTLDVMKQGKMRWRNNSAFAEVKLDFLEDFTRRTNAVYLMVPLPRDNVPYQFIRFESGKFSLRQGPDSDWVLIDKNEFDKFKTWVGDYKVKHGEKLDQ